jgi:hypothetical protein
MKPLFHPGNETGKTPRENPLQKKLLKKKLRKKIDPDDLVTLCIQESSLHGIAQHFSIPESTLAIHLERMLRKGIDLPIAKFISAGLINEIEEAFTIVQTADITRIHRYLQTKATQEQIRIVRGYVQNKYRKEHGDDI